MKALMLLFVKKGHLHLIASISKSEKVNTQRCDVPGGNNHHWQWLTEQHCCLA